MGPFFLENGVFPIFIVWKTGVLESLQSMGGDLIDRISNLNRGRLGCRVGGNEEIDSCAYDSNGYRTAEVAPNYVCRNRVSDCSWSTSFDTNRT